VLVVAKVVWEMLDVATVLFDFVELVTDTLLEVVLEELDGLVLVLDVVVTELEDFVLEELVVEEELTELVVLDVLLVDAPQFITAV
jgi:hypothetical protein